MARNPNFWTMWFNVNHTSHSSGDTERTDSILKTHGPICKTDYVISSSQCKHLDQGILFDRGTSRDLVPDVLKMFCTNEGVTCRDKDQPDGHSCGDYAIRYNCEYTGEAVINAHMFNRHSVSLYYILLVIPILITVSRLLWIFVIRPWRDRGTWDRRTFPRQIRWRKSDRSVDLDLAKPPPSYQDIFGESSPHQNESLGIAPEYSPCIKCQKDVCSLERLPWRESDKHFLPPFVENVKEETHPVLCVSTVSSALHASPQCTRTNADPPTNTVYLQSSKDADLQNKRLPNTRRNRSNHEITSGIVCVEDESLLPESNPSICPPLVATSNTAPTLLIDPSQLQQCRCHSSKQMYTNFKNGVYETELCPSLLCRMGAQEPQHPRVRFASSVPDVIVTSSVRGLSSVREKSSISELPSYTDALSLTRDKSSFKKTNNPKEKVRQQTKKNTDEYNKV